MMAHWYVVVGAHLQHIAFSHAEWEYVEEKAIIKYNTDENNNDKVM